MKPPGRRYRSYRLDRWRKPVQPTEARRRQDFQNSAAHYGLAFRCAMSLGFLFGVRIACADAVDGSLLTGIGWGAAAAACLGLALFLRIESA